jgi:hypothetical protein
MCNKPAAQIFDIQIFNFKKLNEVEVYGEFLIIISNRFVLSENLNDYGDEDDDDDNFYVVNISRAW